MLEAQELVQEVSTLFSKFRENIGEVEQDMSKNHDEFIQDLLGSKSEELINTAVASYEKQTGKTASEQDKEKLKKFMSNISLNSVTGTILAQQKIQELKANSRAILIGIAKSPVGEITTVTENLDYSENIIILTLAYFKFLEAAFLDGKKNNLEFSVMKDFVLEVVRFAITHKFSDIIKEKKE